MTSEKEFYEVYRLPVTAVPTNKPKRREDHDMHVVMSRLDQHAEVLDLVQGARSRGQPVLIGTNSVEESEDFARLLDRWATPKSGFFFSVGHIDTVGSGGYTCGNYRRGGVKEYSRVLTWWLTCPLETYQG